MKKFYIPIFTEEYAVNVFIGKKEELIKEASIYSTLSPKTIKNDFIGRGICYEFYPDKHPLILVDSEMELHIKLATIVHESIHAIDSLMEYISIDMKETEFRSHGVATIIRTIFNKKL